MSSEVLGAHNSDMQEEVFVDCRNGELYVYIGKIDVIIGRVLKRSIDRVEINMLIRHKKIESLGKL